MKTYMIYISHRRGYNVNITGTDKRELQNSSCIQMIMVITQKTGQYIIHVHDNNIPCHRSSRSRGIVNCLNEYVWLLCNVRCCALYIFLLFLVILL